MATPSSTARAPRVTRAQLEPVLQRALKGVSHSAPVVFLRADPDSAPTSVSVGGQTVDVFASRSPLEIRAHLARNVTRDQPLVVLTSCDTSDLGDDLIARALRRKIYQVDRWLTVAEMFGARSVARSLASHAELADALIEARPATGYAKARVSLLDLETAVEALLNVAFELDAERLDDLFLWAEQPVTARAFRHYSDHVCSLVEEHLAARFGEGALFVTKVLRRGLGAEVMRYALAGAVIHHPDGSSPEPAVRLEVALGDPGLSPSSYRSAGDVAEARVVDAYLAEEPIAQWVHGADELLGTWNAAGLAWRSAVSPAGFEQRLEQAAGALTVWRSSPGDETALVADRAVELAHDHLWRREQPQRVERLRMVARLIRRGETRLLPAGTLGQQLRLYRDDGAWLDRARIVVSQSDSNPTVATLCEQLATEFDQARIGEGKQLAQVTAASARTPPPGVLGVEDVLQQVVAPLAASRPVLLVVLDGFSMPIATQLIERLRHRGWNEYIDPDEVVEQPVVAALPTVTEISRTSLLCGELRRGDMSTEARYFPVNTALQNVSKADFPPRLFHKVDFRVGGIDTLPAETIDATIDDRTRIVGVVINNIDERLKDVPAPADGWDLHELAPLAELLDAARRAGRAVVVTSDHGHVLDRNAAVAPAGNGGERWRDAASRPVEDGEIEVSGARVVTEPKSAILPWLEQLRYGPRRNGYHGGITLAELAVPLAVLATDDIAGWTLTDSKPPAWWHPSPPVVPEPAPEPSPQPAPTPIEAPTLFDPEPVATVDSAHAPSSAPTAPARTIARIVESAAVQQSLEQLRLDAGQVAVVLTRLDAANGTPVHEDRLADAANIPRARMGRYVAQLQRLLNIDGYGVIQTSEGEVRFDRALLERQLGL